MSNGGSRPNRAYHDDRGTHNAANQPMRFHSDSNLHNISQRQPNQSLMQFDSSGAMNPFGDSLFPSNLMPMHFGFDSLHARHNRMMQSAMSSFETPEMMMHRNFSSSMGHQMSSSSYGSDSPSGYFSSQVMVSSSSTGPDGQQHVEKYAKASTRNLAHQIAETKEAYSNSSTGVDKLAWERQLANKGRRVVHEKNRETGDVITNDEIAGMTRDDECENFNSEWEAAATEHLPLRPRIPLSVMAGSSNDNRFNSSSSYSNQIAAAGTANTGVRQIEASDVSDEQFESEHNNHNHRSDPHERNRRIHHHHHQRRY